MAAVLPPYAELHCLSNFSFLRGASHPEELVRRAAELGYSALAITDEASMAGVVRAHVAARDVGFHLIVGAELTVEGPGGNGCDPERMKIVVLATDRKGYGNLTQLITRGRRRSSKGRYSLSVQDLDDGLPGCLVLLVPECRRGIWPGPSDRTHARWLAGRFPGRAWIAVELFCGPDDRARLEQLRELGRDCGLPLVAAGDVHMHVRSRRPLQDTLTAIRLGRPVKSCGHDLFPNAERHLRQRVRLARIYPEELLAETVRIAERCRFSLDSLRYQYPEEVVPPGHTPASYLRAETEAGLAKRYPEGVPPRVREQAERELELIAELRYEAYFLTVYDIVNFARSRGILCQGRGSAANSVVCYALFITEVNPEFINTLFERFISRERSEPPDIDVDFEHHRREEVIQYIYGKYGRERTALAATVITYRPRSALRDVGKALGLERVQLDRLSKALAWWDDRERLPERLREAGLDPGSPLARRLLDLAGTLIGFPRHLSQHVGGFVISRDPLSRIVPIENAAMKDRSVVQWDKDDLDALGLLKVDVLGLGMLTVIRRALEYVGRIRGRPFRMQDIQREDAAVYETIQRADTIGVFQIESRAQMSMLPRLKPKEFYDLVIEVAIVRPGPIQGGMVHPYLQRREGRLPPITYPDKAVQAVLARTLGVPIFQEQVMQLAIVAAGFTPGEADRLRRSMAAWNRKGSIEAFRDRLLAGMRERGYSRRFAEQIYHQIQGFGEYGFPESHSASFALLAYASAWLKHHEPAAFLAALLNSQPMGFYAPAQLIRDARRHGVEVRPVDVLASDHECTLEAAPDSPGKVAVRLGLMLVKGLSEAGARAVVEARARSPFTSVEDVARRAALDRGDLRALSAAGAFAGLGRHRREAYWAVAGVETKPHPLNLMPADEAPPALARPTEGEDIVEDYRSMGFTLGRHPLALLRDRLSGMQFDTAETIRSLPHGRHVRTAGLVIGRQRPATASGVVFVTLEDETGHVNVVVWNTLVESQRRELLSARLMGVEGVVEREGEVVHLVARRLADHSPLLGRLHAPSRDFR